jgi:hypothetical protein
MMRMMDEKPPTKIKTTRLTIDKTHPQRNSILQIGKMISFNVSMKISKGKPVSAHSQKIKTIKRSNSFNNFRIF